MTTIYQAADGFFVLTLLACGLLLAWGGTHRWITQAAAVIGGTVGALLAGAGVYAAKHWRPSFGNGLAVATSRTDVWLLIGLAGMVALVAGSAAVLCLLALHSTGALQAHWGAKPATGELAAGTLIAGTLEAETVEAGKMGGEAPGGGKLGWRRALSLAVGGVVLVGLPLALATRGPDYRDITSFVAAVVQFSLPWGVGLALAGWLERRLALVAVGAVAATVALFALVRLAGLPFAWTRGADLKVILLAMLLPIVAAALVAAARDRLPGPRPLG